MTSSTHKADFRHQPEESNANSRLNWLRAGVLGANDGIVSVAALVVGVAAATTDSTTILIAGLASIAAGALSMGVGEFVSVSSQRDAEEATLARERVWHKARPRWELEQLVRLHVETGMSEETARKAAEEQTAHDPVNIHAKMHLGIDPDELTNPWAAGVASLIAFTIGGALPLMAMLLTGPGVRIPLTFATVILALALTGYSAARIAYSPPARSLLRNVLGGTLAMIITYGIGQLIGGVAV